MLAYLHKQNHAYQRFYNKKGGQCRTARFHMQTHNALLNIARANKQVVSIMLEDIGARECLLWGQWQWLETRCLMMQNVFLVGFFFTFVGLYLAIILLPPPWQEQTKFNVCFQPTGSSHTPPDEQRDATCFIKRFGHEEDKQDSVENVKPFFKETVHPNITICWNLLILRSSKM